MELIGEAERGQHNVDAPALVIATRGRQSIKHGIVQRQIGQPVGQFLFGVTDGQATLQGKLTGIQVMQACERTQQGRFAAAIGADQSYAIIFANSEAGFLKQLGPRSYVRAMLGSW